MRCRLPDWSQFWKVRWTAYLPRRGEGGADGLVPCGSARSTLRAEKVREGKRKFDSVGGRADGEGAAEALDEEYVPRGEEVRWQHA